MKNRIRQALGLANEPARANVRPSTRLVEVPIVRTGAQAATVVDDRPSTQLGYVDRNPDSPRQMIGFTPHLRTADEEIRRSWAPMTALARHAITQSGFLSYGLELSCAWAVGGDGLQPHITPDAYALGWQPSFSATWANVVEARYREWSHEQNACDSIGRQKWGSMQSAALKSYLGTGDILAVLDYGQKPNTRWKTAINLIDPTRLWTPMWSNDNRVIIRDGVEMDQRGRPLAYHLRPLPGFNQSIRIPTFSASGKQLLLHAFDAEVGSIRGISPLAAAIQSVMQAQNLQDAAVLASHIATMIVGVVTSDLPSDAVARSIGGPDANPLAAIMAARTEWHEQLKDANAHLQLGHGARIAHLSTGERFDLFAGKVPFDQHEKIIRLALAEAARALGLAPEHLTGLKDQATYSSLKVAAAEVRAVIDRRRKVLIEPLCEFALTSIVEEMLADGRLRWPGSSPQNAVESFRAQKQFALKVEWRGPNIEDPDVLKATRAAIERVNAGLSSISDEIAATGKDPESTLKKRQADEAMLNELGLELPWTTAAQKAARTMNQPKGGKS